MSKLVESERFQVKEVRFLGAGAEHRVDLVKITLGGGRKEIILVRRSPHEDWRGVPCFKGMTLEEHGAYIHSILKEKGYPVPLTWRDNPVTEETYVTDLTCGGRNWVIDVNTKRGPEKGEIKNTTQLEKEIEDIAQKAAKDGLVIGTDVYFCVVDKSSGMGKILLGDLSGGVFEESSPERKKRLAEENLWMARFFLAKITGRS